MIIKTITFIDDSFLTCDTGIWPVNVDLSADTGSQSVQFNNYAVWSEEIYIYIYLYI